MLVKDLRTKNDDELLKLIEDLKAQLFMLRFQNKTGQLDKPHKILNIKKDIARIFTILNARELNFEQEIKSNDKNNSKINQKTLDDKSIKEKTKKVSSKFENHQFFESKQLKTEKTEIDVKISKQKEGEK